MTETHIRRPLSGRKVALMFCGAFATIIGANLALVYSAVGSFPGLETRQPYIEAQSFETRRLAQERLSWVTDVSYSNGRIVLDLKHSNGNAVVIPGVSARVGKATSYQSDQILTLEFDGKKYVADIDLPKGNWQVQLRAKALDGTDFQRTIPLLILDGGT